MPSRAASSRAAQQRVRGGWVMRDIRVFGLTVRRLDADETPDKSGDLLIGLDAVHIGEPVGEPHKTGGNVGNGAPQRDRIAGKRIVKRDAYLVTLPANRAGELDYELACFNAGDERAFPAAAAANVTLRIHGETGRQSP